MFALLYLFICEPFNSWSKKLERKGFLFDCKRTFIDIILTRCRIFCFETAVISLPSSFVKIGFVKKWIKVCPNSGWFEVTRWLNFLFLKRSHVDSILSWSYIVSFVKWESSCFVFPPNSACRVEINLFVGIIMSRSTLLDFRNILLIFNISQSSDFLWNGRVLF